MPDLAGSTVLRRVDRVVQAAVDGDLVLMSPRDFAYFGTEGAGEPVWALIDGERSLDDIVAVLESRYDSEPGVIRAETAEFVDALISVGLVEVSSS